MIDLGSAGSYLVSSGMQQLGAAAGGKEAVSKAACTALTSASGAAAVPASAICSFSAEGLGLLGEAVEAGYGAVSGALNDAGEWIGDAVGNASSGVASLYEEVADLAESSVDAVTDAMSSVGDAVSSTASGIGTAVGRVASYGALAAAAAGKLLNEVA